MQVSQAALGGAEGAHASCEVRVEHRGEVRRGIGAGAQQAEPSVVDLGEGEGDLVAAGVAEGHQPAADPQAAQGLPPGGGAHVVEDDVGTPAARVVADGVGYRGVVAQQQVGTEPGRDGELLVAAGHGHHPGTGPPGQLDGGDADGAGGTLDHHTVTGGHLPDGVGGVPGGTPRGGQGRGLVEVDVARHRVRQVGGDRHELGVAARHVPADDPQVGAVAAVAGQAVRARSAAHRRIDHDPVTDLTVGDRGSDRRHVAGDVHAGDVRQTEAGEHSGTAPLKQVEPVEGAGADLDDHVARTGLGVGDLLNAHRLRASEGRLDKCSQLYPSKRSLFTMASRIVIHRP